jgi:hypothetical protein
MQIIATLSQRVLPLLLMAAVTMVGSTQAYAQSEPDDSTRATARTLGTQGIEAYWANDFETASSKLERAYRLYATATLGLWSARARVQLGQLVAGAERYREALRAKAPGGDPEAQQKALKEARSELEALQPRIPSLTIHIAGARPEEVSVTIGETPVPSAMLGEGRPTDPGDILVVAVRGNDRQQIDVRLREQEQRKVTLQFRPQASASGDPVANGGEGLALTTLSAANSETRSDTPAAPSGATSSSPLKPLGVITMAFGGAGLATAAVTALIANGKRVDCTQENVCPVEVKQGYDSLRMVSMISFYAGAALAAGGLVMFLAAPNDDAPPAPAVSLRVGPTSLGVVGTF